MARPKKEIDKKTFEGLCNLQCTEEEICGFIGVTDKTLTKWCKQTYGMSFSDTFKKNSQGGKISLRRNQFRMAETNAAMAIFLGKQYLGQRDNFEAETHLASDKDFEAMVKALRGETSEDT